MLANQTLNITIQPLTASDSISQAMQRMEKLEVSCLPIVDSTTKKLIGQLKYNQLQKAGYPEAAISTMDLEEPVKIYQRQHIFEGARLMLQHELRLLPVVDDELTFLGVIQKQQVLESITEMLNLAAYGSILTVELDQRDFTLSEIVHLIETEGAKILGITVETPSAEEGAFRVSVKINLQDTTRVAAALRRYNYIVFADESENGVFGFDVETRASELLRYLDM